MNAPTADNAGLWPQTGELFSVDQKRTAVSEHAPLASALTGYEG